MEQPPPEDFSKPGPVRKTTEKTSLLFRNFIVRIAWENFL